MQNELKNTVDSIVNAMSSNETFSIQVFAKRLEQASSAYPEDYTIGMFADVMSKMAATKIVISRNEIRDIYKRLYSRNTKFASLFANELGEITKVAAPKVYNRDYDDESLSIIDRAYEKLVDPVLANALQNAFGNKTTTYSNVLAKQAASICESGLSEFAAKIEIASGNEDVIVCRASFETPKGQTSIFIPVEIVAGKVLQPSVFIGNSGPEDITRKTIKDYIIANVGKRLTVSDKLVLDAVATIKNGDVSKISNVDLAITKLNAAKEAESDNSTGQILYQTVDKVEDVLDNVSTPKYEASETLSAAFDTAIGVAAYVFGNDVVKLGRDVIANHLKEFGLKNSQVSVYDSNDNTIFYAVAVDGAAFRVPVRIQDGKLLAPTVIISNGSMESFSKAGIASISKFAIDNKTAALASQLFTMSSSQLVDIVRNAAAEQNYSLAEEALNILGTSEDNKAYAIAMEAYKNGLNGVKVAETKCNYIVRNATSKHDLCGHTGLPLHKVIQDKDGNCLPAYRKNMESSYDGASFMNSKVYL